MYDSNGNRVYWPVKYYPYILEASDYNRVIDRGGSSSSARIFNQEYQLSIIDSIEDAHQVASLPHCAIAGCTAAAEAGISVNCNFEVEVFPSEDLYDNIFDEFPDTEIQECLASIPVCRNCELTTRVDTFLELDQTECIIELTYQYAEHCGQPFLIDSSDPLGSHCTVCGVTLDELGFHEGDGD